MTEKRRAPKAVGRRVAASMRRVLAVGSAGERVNGVIEGPAPASPAVPVEDRETVARRHLGFDADDPHGLGDWVESEHDEATGGRSDYVRFSRFWREWMAKQNADTLAVLNELGRLTTEQRAALTTLLQREIEGAVKRKIWSRARKVALLGAGGAFAFAHWGADQIAWIKEKAPLIAEVWRWLSGLRT